MSDKDYIFELQQIEGQLAQMTTDLQQLNEEARSIYFLLHERVNQPNTDLRGAHRWAFMTFLLVLAYVVHTW